MFEKLGYLDDRPILTIDRKLADAFNRGGPEEEERVKNEIKEEEKRTQKAKMDYMKNAELNGKAKRKELFKSMIEATKAKKASQIKEREELEKVVDEAEPDD